MPKNKLLTTIACLFVCVSQLHIIAFAQLRPYTSNHIQQFTERDGLPSNSIYTLKLDDLGRVWIGCANGLSVYDGYSFRKFLSNPNDSTVIRGTISYALLKDDDGAMWVGTNPAYIERYDPVTEKFTHQGFEQLVLQNEDQSAFLGFTTSDIVKDRWGNIYAGVSGFVNALSGLLVRRKGSDRFELVSPLPGDTIGNVFRMRTDRTGQVWLTSRGGIFRIDSLGKIYHEETRFPNLPWRTDEQAADFQFDVNNHLWLVTTLGAVFDFDLSGNTFKRYQYPGSQANTIDYGTCLSIHPNGTVWIGTTGGLKVFSPVTKTFTSFDYTNRSDLAKASVNIIIFDKRGQAFIGTSTAGLLHYDEKASFRSLISDPEAPNGLPYGWVDRMVQGKDGTIWGHPQSIVAITPDSYTVKKRYPGPNRLNPNTIITAYWEVSPDSWVKTENRGKIFSVPNPGEDGPQIQWEGLPKTLHIRNRLLDSRGNEWLATLQGLYKREAGSKSFRHYDISKVNGAPPNANNISVIVESRRHNCLWIGGDMGLYRYHFNGDSLSRLLYDLGKGSVLVQQDVNSLYEDEVGVLWIGQWQGGLAKFNPSTNQLRTYDLNDGLPDMAVQAIAKDKKGMLWLSTFNGLSRFNPKAEMFTNFTPDDGLQSSQFADGSVLTTQSGDILFGGSNGLTIVHPEDFTDNYYAPDVFITNISVFGKPIADLPGQQLQQPVYATQKIELRHQDNNLAFDFVAIHYGNPERNRYAVIMENYDSEWRQIANQRQAFYPNLPPGNYIFRVKASNDRGIWNETGASLEIIILPPWWRTWWAYLLYTVLLVIIGFAIHQSMRAITIRNEREKAQLRELEQKRKIEKAYIELDEAHTALQAAQKQLVQSEKMAALGELTAGIAHEIQNPLNFVNNFSEINDELVGELMEELDNGNSEAAKAIAGDIRNNALKINEHGKRAGSIVKGMLEHSRMAEGKKEATDINQLAGECLQLAYHGIRAKDKTFEAEYKTEFDASLPKVPVVLQDFGRVLLNLINNSFYAVIEKAKVADEDYQPQVIVSTAADNDKVMISIKDNGIGIPEEIREKIFQPFFTTKPTGSGTGLGLSLSYDIVRAHGGNIILDSNNKQFTCFIISLPL